MQPTPPPNGPPYRGGSPPTGPFGSPMPGHPSAGPPGYPPPGYPQPPYPPPLYPPPPYPPPGYPPLGAAGYPPGHPAPVGPGHPPLGGPGFPPAAGYGYPAGLPGYPQPPRSTTARRLALAAAVGLVLLLAGGSAVWFFGHHRTSTSTTSAKPDITELTEALLLQRDQFAGFRGDTWLSQVDTPPSSTGGHDAGTDQTISPKECGELGVPDETQSAGSALSGSESGDHWDTDSVLSLTAERFEPTRFLDRCARYTTTFADLGGTSAMVTTTKRVSLPGVPSWAISYTTTIEDDPPSTGPSALYSQVLTVQGYYRGILITVVNHVMSHGKPADVDVDAKLVTLFNAQVAKLAAAP